MGATTDVLRRTLANLTHTRMAVVVVVVVLVVVAAEKLGRREMGESNILRREVRERVRGFLFCVSLERQEWRMAAALRGEGGGRGRVGNWVYRWKLGVV